MCIYNDYIYYTDDLPYGSLYKIKIDGSNKIKVSINSPMYLNIYIIIIYIMLDKIIQMIQLVYIKLI